MRGTRTVDLQGRTYTTNDVSGCFKGGLFSGTDGRDKLDGEDGTDEIRGLGAIDWIYGGSGSDVIYGGPGDDLLQGHGYWDGGEESTKDVLYGGQGQDNLTDIDGVTATITQSEERVRMSSTGGWQRLH